MIKTTSEIFSEDLAKVSTTIYKAPINMNESRTGAIKAPIMESKDFFKKKAEEKKSKKDVAKDKLKDTKDKLMEVYNTFILEGESLKVANDDPENAEKIKEFEAALCEAVAKIKGI